MSKKRYPIEEMTYRAQCYALARTTYQKPLVWVAADGAVFVKEPCAYSGDGWISAAFRFDDPATAFKAMERHRMELVFVDEEFRAIADDGTVVYGASYADAIAGCAISKVFGKKGIRIGAQAGLAPWAVCGGRQMSTNEKIIKDNQLIRESVAKWEAKVALHAAGKGTNCSASADDCPLCLVYRGGYVPCDGCPVRERTGSPYCRGTPYVAYTNVAYTSYVPPAGDRAAAAAARLKVLPQAEVDFLKSLIKEEVTELPPPPPVTLNDEQGLYVIASNGGYSCLGYAVARDHAAYIAETIGDSSLALTPEEFGTLAGYAKYTKAVECWGMHPTTLRKTYYGPGVPSQVRSLLDDLLRNSVRVRLILGDSETCRAWLEDFDVVGTIGRSGGSLRVPLLCIDGDLGGGAILCQNILGVMDMRDGGWLYKHPELTFPLITVSPIDGKFRVSADGATYATFPTADKAFAYAAFMSGGWVEPAAFQQE